MLSACIIFWNSVFTNISNSEIICQQNLCAELWVMLGTFVIVVYFFRELEKHYGLFKTLYYCSLITIPTSFISILGKSYSEFSLSWFQVFKLAMMLYIIFYDYFNRYYFLLTVLFIGFSVIELFIFDDLGSAIS